MWTQRRISNFFKTQPFGLVTFEPGFGQIATVNDLLLQTDLFSFAFQTHPFAGTASSIN